MGRQGGDPAAVSSSIALLQERFMELERAKQKRVGRELTKQSLAAPPRPRLISSVRPDDHEQTFLPHTNLRRPPRNFTLSLGLGTQSNLIDPRAARNQTLFFRSEGFETPDVDTSLHL